MDSEQSNAPSVSTDSQDSPFVKQKESLPRDERTGKFKQKEEIKETKDFLRDDDNLIPLKKYFGISADDITDESKLQSIITELRHLGITGDGEAMQKLKEIELLLGKDHFDNRPSKILTYLRLGRDIKDKLQQMRALENI